MLVFGPLSSLFDVLTFVVMLQVFHAGPELFRTGWFVESLATQTFMIFAVRTRRVPFWRSRPSLPLLLSVARRSPPSARSCPPRPSRAPWGSSRCPRSSSPCCSCSWSLYLALIEVTKAWFYGLLARRASAAQAVPGAPTRARTTDHTHRVHRRAARFRTRAESPTPPG